MRIRSGCKFGTHLLTTSLRSLRGSTPWWPAADFNGDLKVKTTGDRLHLFRRLKFEPAVGWHGSIGEHTFPPSNPRFLTRAATPHSHATARDPHGGSLGGLASVGPARPHPASAANLFLDLPAGLGSRRSRARRCCGAQDDSRSTSSLMPFVAEACQEAIDFQAGLLSLSR